MSLWQRREIQVKVTARAKAQRCAEARYEHLTWLGVQCEHQHCVEGGVVTGVPERWAGGS